MKMFKGLLLALVLVPVAAFAQGKIAVLDLQEAILNTDVAQKELDALHSSAVYKENKKEFDGIKDAGAKLVEKLRKDNAVMSESEQQDIQRQIAEKRADLEHVGRKLQDAEKEVRQKILMATSPTVKAIISDLIEQEGIGLLIDRQAVLHVDSSYSITAKVTEKLNQKLKK